MPAKTNIAPLVALIRFKLISWRNPLGQEFDATFDGRDYGCRTPTSWKTRHKARTLGLIQAVRIRMEQARVAGDLKEYRTFSDWLERLAPGS